MRRYGVIVTVALILCLAAALRLYRLGSYPAGFFCDEASIGYNAFAIAHSGRDEHGVRFPLFFEAFGEYKNPVYIYAAAPLVGLLRCDEFSTRLPAAVFGILTVIFTFLLFREMYSSREGVWAALLLAICNWHIHFSRIAFELISLPCLFTLGLFLLYRGTVRRTWYLWPAALVLGLSLYTYGTARVFVPLFLAGYGLIFSGNLWRKKAAALLAILIFAATAYPLARFGLRHPERARARFDQITVLDAKKGWRENARAVFENYRKHFSRRFLFMSGDPNRRHAVEGFGELYRADIPLYALGIIVMFAGRLKEGMALLWWLALFPAAASITQEVPSATRAVSALPMLPGIAGLGMAFVSRVLLANRRIILRIAGVAAVAAYLYRLIPEFSAYVRTYYEKYPAYSAEGIYGFQYGYRDAIGYMAEQAAAYDRLLLTSAFANRPDIFVKFYTAGLKDRGGKELRDRFSIFVASEYQRYSMADRILYALTPEELSFFSNYEVKRTVKAPDGSTPFVVAHVKKRKEFVRDWLVLGLFDNRSGEGERREDICSAGIDPKADYKGKYGTIRWRRASRSFVRVDLNRLFAADDLTYPGNPEDVCAYALTYPAVPTARRAIIELTASGEACRVWMNGAELTNGPVLIGSSPRKLIAGLEPGANELLIKVCERSGEWHFSARVTDLQGGDFEDMEIDTGLSARRPVVSHEPPRPEKPPAAPEPGHGPGLVAEYFEGTEAAGAPLRVSEGVAPSFSYIQESEKPLPAPFSLRLTGLITIPRDGHYVFALESDDGSRLFIDDVLVVNNWGEHGSERMAASADLVKGTHRVRIEYFDAKWNASLKLLWRPPGGEEQEVPEAALSH